MKSERGNAIVEFIALGLVGQLLIIGFVIQLGLDFRSEIAAQAIARQSLRSFQLTGQKSQATDMANLVSSVFGLPEAVVNISLVDDCSSAGLAEAVVRVRGRTQSAKGFCKF